MNRNGLAMIAALVAVPVMLAGCQSQHFGEAGNHDWNKIQVQFFSPPGAEVTVGKGCSNNMQADRSYKISSYDQSRNKLEREPEKTSTFNLSSGKYEFKYTPRGWKGANVYGEISVQLGCALRNPAVRTLLKRCFIPIALPGPKAIEDVSSLDDKFPYQSSSHRLRISYQDVERLSLGDMITKVVFVADLKKAQKTLDGLEVELAILAGQRRRCQALLSEARMDFIDNPKSKTFINLQGKLTRLEQVIRDKEDKKMRVTSLVQADKVLIRREMLVLATDEILPKHEDPVAAASELGQVVLVLRIGGRHQHWGAEQASAK